MFTPGLRSCGYKTASGRPYFLNRDPLEDLGFRLIYEAGRARDLSELLYGFVNNDPINHWDYLGLALDSPNATFWAALAQGQWAQAWVILETTASAAGRAVWVAAYTRAVAAAVALGMEPALHQANRAWHIVRPDHLWCRLVPLVNNVPANAIGNFQRVQATIAQAWNQGTIVLVTQTGNVVKEAVIQGQRVVVQGRVLLNDSGTVEIVDAWVAR